MHFPLKTINFLMSLLFVLLNQAQGQKTDSISTVTNEHEASEDETFSSDTNKSNDFSHFLEKESAGEKYEESKY